MANNCDFEMKVRGTVDNVKSFINAMKWNGECQNNGVGRVFNCDCCSAYECNDDFVAMGNGYIEVGGFSKWEWDIELVPND